MVTCWIHGCIGLHTWLRLKPRYQPYQTIALGLAVAWPTLSIAGFVAAALRAERMAVDPAWVAEIQKAANFQAEIPEYSINVASSISIGYLIFLALLFTARWLRLLIAKRARPLLLHYHGGRVIEAAPGATVLEILRSNRIPHASVCGERGRCSTCRIWQARRTEGGSETRSSTASS